MAELRENRELRRSNATLRSAPALRRSLTAPGTDHGLHRKEPVAVRSRADLHRPCECDRRGCADRCEHLLRGTHDTGRAPPSARAVRHEDLKPMIALAHEENYGVYRLRKMSAQLEREARAAPVETQRGRKAGFSLLGWAGFSLLGWAGSVTPVLGRKVWLDPRVPRVPRLRRRQDRPSTVRT